jgi:hypothetical protein
MKAIYITAYGNSTQDLKLIEVSEPDTPSVGAAGGTPVSVSATRQDRSDSSFSPMTENSFMKLAGQPAWSA